MITVGTDSYISLADARTYAGLFGLSGVEAAADPLDLGAVAAADATAETNLKIAAKMLDRTFNNKYLGTKKTITQALAWPRNVGALGTYRGEGESWNYTLDSDGNPRNFNVIPVEVGEAQVELMSLIQNGEDILSQPEGAVTRSIEELDVLKSDKTYAKAYRADPLYRVSYILRPVLAMSYGIKATRGA